MFEMFLYSMELTIITSELYMQDTGKVASPRALGSAFSRWIPVLWRYASIRAGIAFSLVFNGLCSLYHILRMLWQRSLPWWQVQLICFLQQSLFVAHYNTTEVNSLSAIEILMTSFYAIKFWEIPSLPLKFQFISSMPFCYYFHQYAVNHEWS